jgi:hypothetical protein
MINPAAGRLLPGNHPLSMNFSKLSWIQGKLAL